MGKLFILFGILLLTLSACNNSTTDTGKTNGTNNTGNANNTSNANNSNNATERDSTRTKTDFSTPRNAAQTFINAAANRDLNLLSRCFSADSAEEFRKFREKTASKKDMDELAAFVEGAKVEDAKESGESAEVIVKFKERDEAITMKKSAEGWKIVDF